MEFGIAISHYKFAAGISKNKLSHQETLENAGMAEKNILNLIKKFISEVKIDDTSRDN